MSKNSGFSTWLLSPSSFFIQQGFIANYYNHACTTFGTLTPQEAKFSLKTDKKRSFEHNECNE